MNTIKLLAKDVLPDRRYIQERMEEKFYHVHPLMRSIITPCAEVAERVLLEAWRDYVEKSVTITRKNHCTSTKHYCTHCNNYCIYKQHNYCPKCGYKIVWI